MHIVTLKREPEWRDVERLIDILGPLDVMTLVVEREPILVARGNLNKIEDLVVILGEVPSADI